MATQIYFIDTKLNNYQTIIDSLSSTDIYYLIDSSSDGLTQMSNILLNYSNLDSIHVYSHGDVGSLNIGNSIYDNTNISNYQIVLENIGKSLSSIGDILLYGCNVGQDEVGKNFINQIAQYTQADVAASDDLTGNRVLGGDWDLEVSSGGVETKSTQLKNYENTMGLTLGQSMQNEFGRMIDTVGDTLTVGGSIVSGGAGVTAAIGATAVKGYVDLGILVLSLDDSYRANDPSLGAFLNSKLQKDLESVSNLLENTADYSKVVAVNSGMTIGLVAAGAEKREIVDRWKSDYEEVKESMPKAALVTNVGVEVSSFALGMGEIVTKKALIEVLPSLKNSVYDTTAFIKAFSSEIVSKPENFTKYIKSVYNQVKNFIMINRLEFVDIKKGTEIVDIVNKGLSNNVVNSIKNVLDNVNILRNGEKLDLVAYFRTPNPASLSKIEAGFIMKGMDVKNKTMDAIDYLLNPAFRNAKGKIDISLNKFNDEFAGFVGSYKTTVTSADDKMAKTYIYLTTGKNPSTASLDELNTAKAAIDKRIKLRTNEQSKEWLETSTIKIKDANGKDTDVSRYTLDEYGRIIDNAAESKDIKGLKSNLITGDFDLYDIRGANGEILNVDEMDKVSSALRNNGKVTTSDGSQKLIFGDAVTVHGGVSEFNGTSLVGKTELKQKLVKDGFDGDIVGINNTGKVTTAQATMKGTGEIVGSYVSNAKNAAGLIKLATSADDWYADYLGIMGDENAVTSNTNAFPTISISKTATVTETDTTTVKANFTVSLSKATDHDVTFSYITGSGTAKRDLDYNGKIGKGVIKAGSIITTIGVDVYADNLYETNETFNVYLKNVNGANTYIKSNNKLLYPEHTQGTFKNNYSFAVIKEDGSVVTWGENGSGVLDGTIDVVDIYSTRDAFAALRVDGSVVTWGYYSDGGDSSSVVSKIDGTIDVVNIYSTGDAFAALRVDGSVVTWGDIYHGGSSDNVFSQIDETIDVIDIYSTNTAFAALKVDGSVVTWGDKFSGGYSSYIASKIDGTIDVIDIYSTNTAFAALKVDGSVVTWGDSRYGGDSSSVVSKIDGTIDVVNIYSNGGAFAALKVDGNVVTWGDSTYGGNSSSVVSKIDGTIDVVNIYSTENAFAALREDGSVVTWGGYTYDYYNEGDSSRVASKIDGTMDVVNIYSTESAFAALRVDGSVVTWGGLGGDSSSIASKLNGTIDVVNIYSNGGAFAALRADGSIVTWGESSYGGDSSSVALKIDGTIDVVNIYSTQEAFAALRADGSIVTWGESSYGGDSSSVVDKLTSGVVSVSNDEFNQKRVEQPNQVGIVTILNDDTKVIPIVFSVNKTAVESNATQTIQVKVKLSSITSDDVTISYKTQDKSAVAGSDYTATSGTLKILKGTDYGYINVNILGDTIYEGDEYFSLILSNPVNSRFANSKSTTFESKIKIIENDLPTDSTKKYIVADYVAKSTEKHFTIGNSTSVSLTGNSLDNTFVANDANNKIDGGTGIDTLSFVNSYGDTTINLGLTTAQNTVNSGTYTIKNIENIEGSLYNDTLTGNSSNNVLNGGTGADIMLGGAGNDIYYVDNVNDKVYETTTTSSTTNATGTDTVNSAIGYTLGKYIENLTLTGTAGNNGNGNELNNVITGNSGANTLNGLTGNDVLKGGAGADMMIGGTGNDIYYVDNVNDKVYETTTISTIDAGGYDTVNSSISYTLSNYVESLTLTGSTVINGTGNSLNNVIYGKHSC